MMGRPRTPDDQRFCRDCGESCAGLAVWYGLTCKSCYNARKIVCQMNREEREGTYVEPEPGGIVEPVERKHRGGLSDSAALKRIELARWLKGKLCGDVISQELWELCERN